MRAWFAVFLFACAAPAAPLAPQEPRAEGQRPTCPERVSEPVDKAPDPERVRLEAELDSVDGELDAIDTELAAAEIAAGMNREQALAHVTSRLAVVSALAVDRSAEDEPVRLHAIRSELYAAKAHLAEIAKDVGPRNPAFVEAATAITLAQEEFTAQRDVESAELTAWRDELMKLPRTAPQKSARQARLRAMRAVLSKVPLQAASDGPATVLLAQIRLSAASRELAVLAEYAGAKHPDRVRLEALIAERQRTLATAVAAALAAIDAEVLALDGKQLPSALDPARVSRRAELARRARDLRAALR